jgi:hypothetical protein
LDVLPLFLIEVFAMNNRLIAIEELEHLALERDHAVLEFQNKRGPEPGGFPIISGVFDPSCLVKLECQPDEHYPWLPDLLANTGIGRWKYSGFIVFDDQMTRYQSPSKYDGCIVMGSNIFGTVILDLKQGRLVDVEFCKLLD